jgi:hypothetical protein
LGACEGVCSGVFILFYSGTLRNVPEGSEPSYWLLLLFHARSHDHRKFYWLLIGSLVCSMMFHNVPRCSRGFHQVSFTFPCDSQVLRVTSQIVPWASMSFHGFLWVICGFSHGSKGRSCDLHECSMGFHDIPQPSMVP